MAYVVWPVIAGVVVFYSISYGLVKMNKMSLAAHRKIWNSLMLLCILAVGSLGILMAAGVYIGNSLFIHVELGLVFVTIAFFHIFWHLYYFKALFNKKKN
jgi:hypothetical protein